MKDVETKLSEAIRIGVRSSGKHETRRYRIEFFRAQLTKAKLEACYYEQMLQLEEQNASEAARYSGLDNMELLKQTIAGVTTLQEKVTGLKESVASTGEKKLGEEAVSGRRLDDEASSVWTGGQETPVMSVKDEESGDEAEWRRVVKHER